MTHRVAVPNLVLAQRVIDKMAAGAARFLEDETGEAMIGLVTGASQDDTVPTIYVLDTIPPDESNVVRETYAFQQGDDLQFEFFNWFYENWNSKRKKDKKSLPSKWDAPLTHLGDWHKQPGFMIAPSGGDLASALDQLDDPEIDKDFLLVPIVTLGHPTTIQDGAGVNYLSVPLGDGTSMRVDFWYIHKKIRLFQPINPVVQPNKQLPEIPEYPWHLANLDRANEEFARFQKEQIFVSVVLWDTDNKPPLEVCVAVARMGVKDVFILVTAWDYPYTAPIVLRAPYIALGEDQDIYDVFKQWWVQAETIDPPPGWKWTPDKYLIDYVHAVEKHLGIEVSQPQSTTEDEA